MKYEAVFGNQGLFDGMMPDCEFIVGTYWYKIKDGKCFYCEKYNQKYAWSPTGDAAKALYPVIAMRRIIAEPKRWTVEDQKAGRLPDVGAEVQFNFYQSAVMRQGVIKYIDDQVAVIQTEDVTRPFCYETCKVVFTPIETPEEKAERLEDEFVNELMKDSQVIYTSSEQLAMCRKTARAAYRKLSGALSVPTKGGE